MLGSCSLTVKLFVVADSTFLKCDQQQKKLCRYVCLCVNFNFSSYHSSFFFLLSVEIPRSSHSSLIFLCCLLLALFIAQNFHLPAFQLAPVLCVEKAILNGERT